VYGELLPLGTGKPPIPLEKSILLVGRHAQCDITLTYSTVSGKHCRLLLQKGYWHVHDLGSRNGTRVNGIRVTDHCLEPGNILSIATYRFEISYSPVSLGATGPPPVNELLDSPDEIFGQSLMDRASSSGIGSDIHMRGSLRDGSSPGSTRSGESSSTNEGTTKDDSGKKKPGLSGLFFRRPKSK